MEVQEAYKNIEKIIKYGFLCSRISIYGYNFIIKNITDKEYQNLSLFCFDNKSNKVLFTIAYCTAFINGINLLENREENVLLLVEHYKKMPEIFITKVIDAINELNKIYIESIEYLEGYSYSKESRHLWGIMDPYKRSSYLGIRGIDDIGLNSVIENWIQINERLDEEEEYYKNLQLTLLIVGTLNYKNARKISRNYENHMNELKELREEIVKYGHSKNREKAYDKKREQWTAPLVTREDLVKELNRRAMGYKDKHDNFIEEWIEEQRRKAEEAKKQVEEQKKKYKEKMEQEYDNKEVIEASRTVSKEEIEKLNLNKKLKRMSNRII